MQKLKYCVIGKIGLLVFTGLISTISFSQSISQVWISDSLFLKPESALYDSSNHIVYISNVNGEYLAKDENGFISKIKINGEIDSLKWINGNWDIN